MYTLLVRYTSGRLANGRRVPVSTSWSFNCIEMCSCAGGTKTGQDNPSTECIVGDVPNIFEGDEANHDGPYNGIVMDCT